MFTINSYEVAEEANQEQAQLMMLFVAMDFCAVYYDSYNDESECELIYQGSGVKKVELTDVLYYGLGVVAGVIDQCDIGGGQGGYPYDDIEEVDDAITLDVTPTNRVDIAGEGVADVANGDALIDNVYEFYGDYGICYYNEER
ncbi:MAG: hypothetical protein EZS28_038779 [Streblomastix strix]|uniref:Uncharacterized protein n=1 Tax=Streblomastix strix TaxID=222440 RepID=A0A5J4U5Z9_9EUKA|nr:MAG: hypothetical protein EZS28_038779 [Streblomastix strix]